MTLERQVAVVDVLGIHVGVLSPGDLVATIARWVAAGQRHYVTFTGVHGVMESQRSPELLDVHNAAGVVAPDGMPLVWAGTWSKAGQGSRCYGPDLTLMLCEQASNLGWPVFLYGGKEGVPEMLAERLVERFPSLKVVGTNSPPFRELTDDEIDAEVAMINDSGAVLVFVGLSTPKQERWMSSRRPMLAANVLLGVGAAFDFHAGLVKQAPRWMQRSGLEWAYRLFTEPRRLAKRYLRNNPAFVVKILRHRPRVIRTAD